MLAQPKRMSWAEDVLNAVMTCEARSVSTGRTVISSTEVNMEASAIIGCINCTGDIRGCINVAGGRMPFGYRKPVATNRGRSQAIKKLQSIQTGA